jgi:hypothetical protein
VVLMLLILVPSIGIIAAIAYKKGLFRQPEPVQEPAPDPNQEIEAVMARFKDMQAKTRTILQGDRESSQFSTQTKSMCQAWDKWIEDFDRTFAKVKNADGTWPKDFEGYSRFRANAGQLKSDLMRTGGF